LAQFQFRAADAEGKVVEGTIEAAESSAVVARLQDRGLIPIRVGALSDAKAGAVRAARTPSRGAFQRKPSARHLLIVTQELAALLTAGLPLDRSLNTLVELADHPEVKRVLDEVLTAVRSGKSLADSLGQHKFFPTLYVSMVRAGEVGGFLDSVLQRLADYLDRAHALRSEVRNALTYPVVLTVVLGGSLVFLLVVVLPRFSELFEGMGAAMPLPAKLVMGMSDVLRGYWWLGAILIVLGTILFRRSLRTPAGRLRWDQIKLRIPLLGLIFRKLEAATLTRTLGTLMRSGVPMIQALETVRAIAGNVVIANAVGEVEVGVREGAGVANPLARTGAFPPLAVQMISVGEETGKLDEMLLKIADYYDREVRMQIDQFMGLLEPVLILVMGLLVGTVVVSMLMAIFSVNDFAM
jgi:general secretion pathway protein F